MANRPSTTEAPAITQIPDRSPTQKIQLEHSPDPSYLSMFPHGPTEVNEHCQSQTRSFPSASFLTRYDQVPSTSSYTQSLIKHLSRLPALPISQAKEPTRKRDLGRSYTREFVHQSYVIILRTWKRELPFWREAGRTVNCYSWGLAGWVHIGGSLGPSRC